MPIHETVKCSLDKALDQNEPTKFFDKDYILVMVDKGTFNRWGKVPNGELKLKSFIAKELAKFEQSEVEAYKWNEQV